MTELEEFDQIEEHDPTLLEHFREWRSRRRVWKALRERQRTNLARGDRADRIVTAWVTVGVVALFLSSILGLLLLLGPFPE